MTLSDILKVSPEEYESLSESELEARLKDILPLTRPAIHKAIEKRTTEKQTTRVKSQKQSDLTKIMAALGKLKAESENKIPKLI